MNRLQQSHGGRSRGNAIEVLFHASDLLGKQLQFIEPEVPLQSVRVVNF